MPRQFVYKCTRCGKIPSSDASEAREKLTAKSAVFKTVGAHGRTLRSRTTAWLCNECLLEDPEFQLPDAGLLDTVAADMAKGA